MRPYHVDDGKLVLFIPLGGAEAVREPSSTFPVMMLNQRDHPFWYLLGYAFLDWVVLSLGDYLDFCIFQEHPNLVCFLILVAKYSTTESENIPA